MGEGSTMPTDTHHTPIIIQPSTSQPQKTQKPRRPIRKDTEVPQPSGPITNVADEAVNEEMDDSLVRAATTVSSLEAEQDSGNIDKTQSKATPNEPSVTPSNLSMQRNVEYPKAYIFERTRVSQSVDIFDNCVTRGWSQKWIVIIDWCDLKCISDNFFVKIKPLLIQLTSVHPSSRVIAHGVPDTEVDECRLLESWRMP
ncbi:hypothetical protein Tco_0254943 [Tanacetum coccineum]